MIREGRVFRVDGTALPKAQRYERARGLGVESGWDRCGGGQGKQVLVSKDLPAGAQEPDFIPRAAKAGVCFATFKHIDFDSF